MNYGPLDTWEFRMNCGFKINEIWVTLGKGQTITLTSGTYIIFIALIQYTNFHIIDFNSLFEYFCIQKH